MSTASTLCVFIGSVFCCKLRGHQCIFLKFYLCSQLARFSRVGAFATKRVSACTTERIIFFRFETHDMDEHKGAPGADPGPLASRPASLAVHPPFPFLLTRESARPQVQRGFFLRGQRPSFTAWDQPASHPSVPWARCSQVWASPERTAGQRKVTNLFFRINLLAGLRIHRIRHERSPISAVGRAASFRRSDLGLYGSAKMQFLGVDLGPGPLRRFASPTWRFTF